MKLMRLAMCVAAFAVIGKIAYSEDVDVRSLQAKLAAQEARLNDLQAKVNYKEANANYAGAPEGVLSINKNATVSIGGTINTRYWNRTAKITNANGTAALKINEANLQVSDANVAIHADVTDNFEAHLLLVLQRHNQGADMAQIDESHVAEQAYVRWKNVCNTGFGLKVGRAPLVFGMGKDYGVMQSWAGNHGDGIGALASAIDHDGDGGNVFNGNTPSIGAGGMFIPAHASWDVAGITQVTPEWVGMDGKLSVEVSFMQGNHGGVGSYSKAYPYNNNGDFRSRNVGFGSMSGRIKFAPIEGLLFEASILNYYARDAFVPDVTAPNAFVGSEKNSTAFDLGFKYRPACFNRMQIWGEWVHGWDVNHISDYDTDVVNAGIGFDVNESFSVFAQGDYLRARSGNYGNAHPIPAIAALNNARATGWASYIGAKYKFGYGAALEAGWKHERIKMKVNGVNNGKITGDTIYAHLGFDF